jgi:N-acetylmuramoyl-L-alanine amidase-like protein
MRRLLTLVFVLAGAAVLAPSAVSAVAQVELEPSGDSAAKRFTLAGVRWQGEGRVLFRTRSFDGRWSGWRPATPEDEDGPDPSSREARARAGWRLGNPYWVGPSDRIQTRTIGRVSRVRAYLVQSTARRIAYRAPAVTGAPAIVSRASWGASESIRRGSPSYATSIRGVTIHHTAGTNGYSRAQAPAIVKGIQLFHVQSNGWNDIGYNFLVDRFGTVYEGRFGGVDRNVIGAHARGFNTGSVGIALIGTYSSATPPAAALAAIERLVAWRLDLAHVDPTRTTTVVSSGSERYRSGTRVVLRNVSGHRDTGLTTCPGNVLYGRLDALAANARAIGLPKIFDPRVDEVENLYRFRARVSSTVPWIVQIKATGGALVAQQAGTGTAIDWTWDATLAPGGRYTWTISAGTALPAAGPLRIARPTAPLAIQATADSRTITPNGDGQADDAVLSYRLSTPANLTIAVTDALGVTVLTVVDRVWTGTGQRTATVPGASLADGFYNVVLSARTAAGPEVRHSLPLTVTRTLAAVSLAPVTFSPNADGRNDQIDVGFALTMPATVRARVVQEERWVATALRATALPAGSHRIAWRGKRRLPDGAYTVVLEVTDALTTFGVELPFVSDSTAPTVEILPTRKLRVRVSEPATLILRIDGTWTQRQVRKAGVVNVPDAGSATRVRVLARDLAGNTSRPALRVRKTG